MVSVIVLIIAAMAPAVAPAAERDTKVKEYLESGIQATRQGEYDTAYKLFRRANELGPSAQTLGQLGLAENRLKKWAEGEAHLTAALRLLQGQPSGPVRPALESALADATTHVGSLHVLGTAGAIVTIDGNLETRLPSEGVLRLSEGKRHLHARAAGYESQDVDVTIEGQREFKVTFDLRRPTSLPVSTNPVSTNVSATSARRPGGGEWRPVGWCLLGSISFVAVEIGFTDMVKPLFSGPHHALRGGLMAGAGVLGLSIASVALWHGPSRDGRVAIVLGPASLDLTGQF